MGPLAPRPESGPLCLVALLLMALFFPVFRGMDGLVAVVGLR